MPAGPTMSETSRTPTEQGYAPTRPVKRSFTLAGHRTSISLEAAFWEALREAAGREKVPLAELVRRIDQQRGDAGLSGAVRVWVLDYFKRRD
jgi:predicted DNA-binding ribbon-helix-helix protein